MMQIKPERVDYDKDGEGAVHRTEKVEYDKDGVGGDTIGWRGLSTIERRRRSQFSNKV